jgi:ketosteroid isomerase-like protein
MSDLQALMRRIGRLEARAEICELVSAYAIACDEHDLPRLTRLFAADAVLDSPSKLVSANGSEAIRDMFIRLFRVRGPACHWTHDHLVSFDAADPDRATGVVLGHAETCLDNEVCVASMRYADDYRRVDGRWVFGKRVLSFLYYVPAKEYSQALSGPLRVSLGGNRLPGDYPESLPGWKAFDREHGRGA